MQVTMSLRNRTNTKGAKMSEERNLALETIGIDPKTRDDELSGDQLIDFYIELANIQKQASNTEKSASAAMKSIQEDVIKHFIEHGQERVTRRGRTLYLARELWPKVLCDDLIDLYKLQTGRRELTDEEYDAIRGQAKDRLVEALKNSPYTEHLVTESFNSQSLRGFMSKDCEIDPDGFPIVPEHLDGMLGSSEVFRAKVLAR